MEWIPIKIITEFNHQRSIHFLKNENYNKVVVGLEIMIYLEHNSGFHFDSFNEETHIEKIGSMMGLEVFKDNTQLLKWDEYLFFNDEKEI